MVNSSETDSEVKHRGRPRKHPQVFRFGPHVYNTPLGFQYTQPLPFMSGQQSSTYTQTNYMGTGSPMLSHRVKRSAAIRATPTKKKKGGSSEEVSASESRESNIDEDAYEKLLDYDETRDAYFVKLRNKSYLHATWVAGSEIRESRVGAMKAKRYKHVGLDPEYVKVDRILAETFEGGVRYVLVKWCTLPYEQSTYERWSDVKECDGFEREIAALHERKKMRHVRMGVEWRPGRENQVKYTESGEYGKGNKLRAYQLEGLNWLLNRWYFRQSCIMADEMGLGKTVQSVTFVEALFRNFDYTHPILVVAPLSTLGHWEREFKNWTNLRVVMYHGSIQGRDMINEYEFAVRTGNITVRLFDVVITTYEMAMAAGEHLTRFEYGVGIFDEAHRLKNHNSKAATCLRGFSIAHKVLLSGTPIQNNLNELWALFNFIDGTRFHNLSDFLAEFKMEKAEDVQKLQDLLKPLMLRRMKDDVETSIPMKEETIIEVELTMIQKRYYRAILEKNMEFLTKGDRSNAPNLVNAMMELRKCCIHPYLLNGAESKIIGDYIKRGVGNAIKMSAGKVSGTETVDNSGEVAVVNNTGDVNKNDASKGGDHKPIKIGDFYFKDIHEYYKILIHSSGKLVLLDKLLAKLQGRHKVLIFSQMTRCLDLLSEYLTYRNYLYERIDGGVRGDLRQAAIDRFSSGDAFVFLLCTRAGGVGINLTAADTVVIFDSDWNPQNDLQAQARCHRIGQKNEVKIYRLITKNSYEREMFDKAGLKLGLDRAVLQKMSFNQRDETSVVGREDAIQLLLRKGAYGVLMDTDDVSQKFCEEDIDQILSRRTKIIRHSDGGNAFSKATFQVDEEIEDPDFWENLLSQKKFEENEGRIKRQCRRLAREGVITPEQRKEIGIMYDKLNDTLTGNIELTNGELVDNNFVVGKSEVDGMKEAVKKITSDGGGGESGGAVITTGETTYNKISCTDEEVGIFVIFVTVLHKSPFAVNIDFFNDTVESVQFRRLCQLVKYCIDLISITRLKNDFLVHLERFLIDYDPNLFLRFSDFYLRFHEQFLFRIQVPCIIHALGSVDDVCIEKSRGFSHEDDKVIISSILSSGYDTFKVRDKSVEDVNQRVRKIISVLYHQKEMRENDNMYFKTLFTFGRPTDKNELSIEKFLPKDASKLNDLVERICKMTKRARRDITEAGVYDRIQFFDKLEALVKIPSIRRTGMPPRWDSQKDVELRDHLLVNGFQDIDEKFKLTEEQIIKRFESIFKATQSNKE